MHFLRSRSLTSAGLVLAVAATWSCAPSRELGRGTPDDVERECAQLRQQASEGNADAVSTLMWTWHCGLSGQDAAAAGLVQLARREPADSFVPRLRRVPIAPDSAIMHALMTVAEDGALPDGTRAVAGERLERALQGWARPRHYSYATPGPNEPDDCSPASGVVHETSSHGSVNPGWRPPSPALAVRWMDVRREWIKDAGASVERRRVAHGCRAGEVER